MCEFKLIIEAPELSLAINRLADAIAFHDSTGVRNPLPEQPGAALQQQSAPTYGAAPAFTPATAPQSTIPTQTVAPAQMLSVGGPLQQVGISTQTVAPSSAPVTAPQPGVPTQPATPTPTPTTALGIPLAQPPKYTVTQIQSAGSALMDAGKGQELINLLHSFGVQAVTDLKPEQLGAFATAMRELGAKI